MKKLLGIALLSTAIFAACNKDDEDDALMNQTDREFMEMAAYGNYNEIAAGRIADSGAVNPAVDMFGRMMIKDHTVAAKELNTIAQQMGAPVPKMPDSAHIAQGEMLRSLARTPAFDQAYMNAQVEDHLLTINLFQHELDSGNNQDLRAYALKYLPKIQMHLKMADSIRMTMQQ